MKREKTQTVNKVVIKVGSSTLTNEDGRLDYSFIQDLTRQISQEKLAGRKCILVSSGAIRAGVEKLQLNGRPKTIPEKQAAAAVGQGLLMHVYNELFGSFGITAAQVLLTRDDFINRTRYLNARNTLNTLLEYGCVPIINENDTVAVEEIRFGDNDSLAALVASAVDADLLINLSDVGGLYDGNPSESDDCSIISEVTEITPEIESVAGDTNGVAGTGGMRAKIEAAKVAVNSGITMVIANGRRPGVISEVVNGKVIGTRFTRKACKLNSRKRWVAFGMPVRGTVIINDGACKMVVERGKSLLAAGVVGVTGNFCSGDLVAVTDEKGKRLARGFTNYSASDMLEIKGRRSNEIESILGHKDYDEVIHRDNLVIGV